MVRIKKCIAVILIAVMSMEICSTSVSATNISDEVFNTNEVSQNEIEVDEDIHEDANDKGEENILETETSASENVRNKIISYVNGLGGSFNKSYAGKASGCFALCNYVWKNVFGYDYYAKKHTRKEDASGGNHIYSFLVNNGAKAGDILWLGGEHNVIILSYDSNGMTITDGSSSGKVLHNGTYLKYTSSGIANYLRSSKKLVIYKSNDAIFNSLATPDPVRDTTPPQITNIRVTDVGIDGYTVSCTVTDNMGVNRVQFPTWTSYNDQDDIIQKWSIDTAASGSRNGNTFTYRVNRDAHNGELFNYNTHIYAYDNYGNSSAATGIFVDCLLGDKVDVGQKIYVRIENVGSGTYLAYGNENAYGENYKKNALCQKWYMIRLEDGSYCILAEKHGELYRNREDIISLSLNKEGRVTEVHGGKSLDVCAAANANGTNVQVYDSNNSVAQKWNVYRAPQGYYIIPECSINQALDLDGATGNLQTHRCWKGTPQYFYIQQYETDDIDRNNHIEEPIDKADDIGKDNHIEEPSNKTDDTSARDSTFVSRMYTVALSRNAEEKGLSSWTQKLQNGEIDGAGIANGFINSAEFKNRNLNNNDYLDVLYRTFFDREADAGGKAYWMGKLQKGISRTEVLSGFVNSQEFSNLCDRFGIARGTMQANGSSIYRPGVRGYVLRMYTKALNRDGETVGVEDWTNRINTKVMSPETVAKSFFSSQEFINRNLNNADYVETLYQTFMDRASDAGGKQYWINKLNSGMSRQQVLEGFSRSEEFSKIMKRYGL